MRTVPRSIVKSSTEDLTRPTFCIAVKYRVDHRGYRYSNTGRGEYRRSRQKNLGRVIITLFFHP
jgi:hypothetical protein